MGKGKTWSKNGSSKVSRFDCALIAVRHHTWLEHDALGTSCRRDPFFWKDRGAIEYRIFIAELSSSSRTNKGRKRGGGGNQQDQNPYGKIKQISPKFPLLELKGRRINASWNSSTRDAKKSITIGQENQTWFDWLGKSHWPKLGQMDTIAIQAQELVCIK